MDWFVWAQNNLDAQTPHELQARGVQVYFAPNIPYNVKLVNLGIGTVTEFHTGEDRGQYGLYADYDSLERYTRKHNLPFVESGGQISVD